MSEMSFKDAKEYESEKPRCETCGFHHFAHIPCPTVERVYGGPPGRFGVMMIAAVIGSLLLFSIIGIIIYVLRIVFRHHFLADWLPGFLVLPKN